ncbi:major facilitator superfamily MFS_1 [Coriobacterium glomerans PW2]|uniref:Major facilitator superfamily MFS_1 n=1 Tax=Coriobacterium glomerans (strain ATCC 49209 / DSM 20642 / JCM 10262 / PW2) TaxID=700015 RepID=F2N748_CORGP|nr:MFS transporter [Coriobacterium glomerans]AEB06387.1 major facilitator superfamily MFS_1 [Coriobacterium glomerans PW2]
MDAERQTAPTGENEAGTDSSGGSLLSSAFIALLAAQLFSLGGATIVRFVMPLRLLNLTGSAALYGAVAAAAFVPYVLIAPVGGVLADRMRKQRLMASLDFCLAIVCLGYLVLTATFDATIVSFAALMLVYAGLALYQPAIQVCVASLADAEHVTQAVAVVTQVSMLTSILGPVLGGAVLGFFGIGPIMEISIAAFAISCALIVIFVRVPCQRHDEQTSVSAAGTAGEADAVSSGARGSRGLLAIFTADIRDAARFLRHRPVMWHAIVFGCLLNLVLAAGITIGSPHVVTEYLGLSNQFMGIAEAALGFGGLVGGALVAARPRLFRFARVPTFVLASGCSMIPFAVALAARLSPMVTFIILMPCLALIFGFCSCISIALMGYLQQSAPTDLVGKVMSLMFAAVNCATPLGQLIYGVAFDAFQPVTVILAMLGCTLVLYLVMCSSFRTAHLPA